MWSVSVCWYACACVLTVMLPVPLAWGLLPCPVLHTPFECHTDRRTNHTQDQAQGWLGLLHLMIRMGVLGVWCVLSHRVCVCSCAAGSPHRGHLAAAVAAACCGGHTSIYTHSTQRGPSCLPALLQQSGADPHKGLPPWARSRDRYTPHVSLRRETDGWGCRNGCVGIGGQVAGASGSWLRSPQSESRRGSGVAHLSLVLSLPLASSLRVAAAAQIGASSGTLLADRCVGALSQGLCECLCASRHGGWPCMHR